MSVAIELHGGPLDGCIHEMAGVLMPAAVGLLADDQPNRRHWYQCVDGRWEYSSSEEVSDVHK